ncbi:hypothetical protein QFZ75_004049 [Streptomyces sp. V3I8]|uniref:SCO4225 family membrane protein n=1 Tax=Streptomyces sp. V3I8 TaxID=3042279 RepID=UPI002786F428|nr:hypothetical protein [Streptomyces sp. V3I8]MDQ1037633.1 hypothetical protein [Streptomyces sp. V3I8]
MTGKSLGRRFGRMSLRRPIRFLTRPLSDVFARVYLLGCAALLGWALVASAGDGSDGSMALVIPLFATAPACLVPLLLLPEGAGLLLGSVVVGALANAMVIGWCARALRGGRDRGADPVS